MPAVGAQTNAPDPIDLMSSLTPRDEVVLLARTLYRQGYADQLAGHITYRLPDDTMLVNPWELAWDELLPDDILTIDLDGKLLEGNWTVPGGIPLHLALHQARDDVTIAVHNHSMWGTVWCDLKRVPPVYDQTSAFAGEEIAICDEYRGVGRMDDAALAIAALGRSKMALLANHGVMIVATSIFQAYVRAVTLEWRCRQAWVVEAAGGGHVLPAEVVARHERGVDGAIDYPDMLWKAAARRELRLDPALRAAVGRRRASAGVA